MTDRNTSEQSAEVTAQEAEAETRRAFLKTVSEGAAKSAVTVPAVALLLSAGTRPKEAQASSGTNCGGCGGGS